MRARTLTVTVAMAVMTAVPTAQAVAQTGGAAAGLPVCHRARYPEDCQMPTRVVAVARADGFDWGDAGIGAGGALGGVLVATGFGALIRRPRRVVA